MLLKILRIHPRYRFGNKRQRTGLLDSVQVWWTRTGRACCTHWRCLYVHTHTQSPSGGDTLPSRGDTLLYPPVYGAVVIFSANFGEFGAAWKSSPFSIVFGRSARSMAS